MIKVLIINRWEEAVIYRALREHFESDVAAAKKAGVQRWDEEKQKWIIGASVEGRTAKDLAKKFRLTEDYE